MIKRMLKYKRFLDIINFREFECYVSLVISLLFIVFSVSIKMHENYSSYFDMLSTLIVSFIEAFIAMSGIILSGVAIISSLFSGKLIQQIGNDKFEEILSSFEYLAFNSALAIPYLIVINLIMISPLEIVNPCVFYIILTFTVYLIFFIILYSVALVGNCIDLYKIRNISESIEVKRTIDIANEIRIDLLLKNIYDNPSELKNDLIRNIREMKMSNDLKESLILYFEHYYSDRN